MNRICKNLNHNICKNWSSNVKSLRLGGIKFLDCISSDLFITGLNNIKFKSLKTFLKTEAHNYNEYCTLQTKPFTSTVQLVNMMKLINNNTCLMNSINDLYLQTIIDCKMENTAQVSQYLNQICDILSQWFNNENKNILLRFEITSENDRYTHFEYPQQLATCLYDKIAIDNYNCKHVNSDSNKKSSCTYPSIIITPLTKGKFVSPYYGGNAMHFDNRININDRLAVGVHMEDREHYHGDESKIRIEFMVQMLAKGATFERGHSLIRCKCYDFGSHDDDWDDDDDGDWGSTENLDVFDEYRMKKELTVKVTSTTEDRKAIRKKAKKECGFD